MAKFSIGIHEESVKTQVCLYNIDDENHPVPPRCDCRGAIWKGAQTI